MIPGALDGQRVSLGGAVPDFLVNMIAAEVATLDAKFTKAKVSTTGNVGTGATRHARFSVEGSS